MTHRVRLSPLQPQTEWTLEDGVLTERRGRAVRRFPLSTLSRLDLVRRPRRGARLRFGWIATVMIPADSFAGPGRWEDHGATFQPLLDALMAEAAHAAPQARVVTGGADPGAALLSIAIVLGTVAVGFAGLSLALGAPSIGLALGARMLFAAILLLAVRPWLSPGA